MDEEDGGCLAVIAGGIMMVCLVAAAFGKLPLWIWVLVGALIVTAIVGGTLFIYTEFAPAGLRRRSVTGPVAACRQPMVGVTVSRVEPSTGVG